MDDFLELGIEAADKCVEKNFHKLPDKALHSETYHPRNIKQKVSGKIRGDARMAEESSSDNERLDKKENRRQEQNRHTRFDGDREKRFEPTRRDRDNPHETDSDSSQDASRAQARQSSYGTSPSPPRNRRNCGHDTNYDPLNPEHQDHLQQNPYRISSQSYDKSRTRDTTSRHELEDGENYHHNRRRSNVGGIQNTPQRQRARLAITTSDKNGPTEVGLRYSALGAMLGGLAAQELTSSNSKSGNDKVAYAMLGAAVGAWAGKSLGERVHEDRGKMTRKTRKDRYES